jgi:NADH:ubiquinone oxidoreductase subunit F (NADH-binding)
MNFEQLIAKAKSECPDSGARKDTIEPNRIALKNCGLIDPENIYEYISYGHGYCGLAGALEMSQGEVIAELRKSGLRGRGGGGYLTAEKWEICRETDEHEKYLICNAIDADPKSHIARVLLEGDPHAILEGMCIGAYATDARRGFICVNAGYETAIKRLGKARQQMRENSLLGENILDSGFQFDIEIKEVAASLVAGEETALIRSLENRQAMPYLRTVYPAVSGFNNKPTLVNNVETLAHITAIFQKGAAWYATTGTERSRGTKILTVTGDLVKKSTVEVPLGTTLRAIIEQSVGGVVDGEKIKAVQLGGPTGTFLGADSLGISLAFETMKESRGIIGSGTIEVFDDTHCAVEMARDAIAYIQSQSCGKCTFCREGSYQMADILSDISENRGKPGDLELLQELGETMPTGSICGLGKTAPGPVLSSIRLFREDYEAHINNKTCLKNRRILRR